MEALDIKKFFFIVVTALLNSYSYSQNKNLQVGPLRIIKDISKSHYYLGDTLRIAVKNVDKKARSVGVEAFISNAHNSRIEFSDYYTAYFNEDFNWFKKNQANEKKINNFPPKIQTSDPEIKYFNIDSGKEYIFSFPIKGKLAKKMAQIQLNFVTDFIEGEDDVKLLSKKFYLHTQYN